MEKKMTKKEMYNVIINACSENAEIVEFCNHEIELLDKKNSRTKTSATKTQKENALTREIIANVLTIEPATISEIGERDDALKEKSSQKLSALLNQLVKEGRAVKGKDKKKVTFALASEQEEEE